MPDRPWEDRPPTLGELLDVRAQRVVGRLLPVLAWAAPLRVLVDHVTALAPAGDRFERVEAGQGLPLPHLAPHPPAHPTTDPTTAPQPVPAGLLPASPAPVSVAAARAGAGPEGRPLPPDVRGKLRDALGEHAGRAADALRVHDDGAADGLACAHRADAVTVGRDVHFRQGRYRPGDDTGFALLAHETTHVLALLEPGSAWQRVTGGGRRDEEARAQAGERAGLTATRSLLPSSPGVARPVVPAGAPFPVAPVPAAVPAPPSVPAAPPVAAVPGSAVAHPMTAAQGRDVTPAAAAPDLEALRSGLVEELMRRLRTEFERGA